MVDDHGEAETVFIGGVNAAAGGGGSDRRRVARGDVNSLMEFSFSVNRMNSVSESRRDGAGDGPEGGDILESQEEAPPGLHDFPVAYDGGRFDCRQIRLLGYDLPLQPSKLVQNL